MKAEFFFMFQKKGESLMLWAQHEDRVPIAIEIDLKKHDRPIDIRVGNHTGGKEYLLWISKIFRDTHDVLQTVTGSEARSFLLRRDYKEAQDGSVQSN